MVNNTHKSPLPKLPSTRQVATRHSKHATPLRPIRDTLLVLALRCELYARTGGLLDDASCHPLVTAIATAINRRGWQPLTACIVAYCRYVDSALAINPGRKPLPKPVIPRNRCLARPSSAA